MTRKVFLVTLCFLCSIAFLRNGSWGADVCVDSASTLQDALDDAEISGESDVIRVVQGTYYGNF
ncbi:MAG: hypothetical protein JRJ39_03010 [Deltaproteobacteria bacterium]|nr:hypothetical protein [Deltaproteobacteria bacterium]